MGNLYLVSFDSERVDRLAIKNALESADFVRDWIIFLPGAFAVRLTGPKEKLFGLLRRTVGPGGTFLISSLSADGKTGVAPGPLWDFIYDPRYETA
jgi:hypothetical protein